MVGVGVRHRGGGGRWWVRAALLGLLLLAWAAGRQGWIDWRLPQLRDLASQITAPGPATTDAEEAWRQQRSGVMVEVEGEVQRLLPDDLEGSRHQRFIVQLASGHSLLVAHNIDLANWVPLKAGDRVRLRGQYEWNNRGGVVHWTHHDPDGDREGGWIEHKGERYR